MAVTKSRDYDCLSTLVKYCCADATINQWRICAVLFICAVTVKNGSSLSCSGLLQADPLEVIKSRLELSAYNSMYLYTQPLANSSCRQGRLLGFNFCYRAILSQLTEPVFTIALLHDTGSEYIVGHIYREMEDRVHCLNNINKTMCCRWVTAERTLPLIVDSSFSLAIVTSAALGMGNGHLYETHKFSRGVVYSPPPALLGEVGSSVVGLERRATGQIPELFIRIVLIGTDEATTNAADSFFHEYLFIVVGVCMVLLALLSVFVAVLVLVTLKVKFKRLQKRLRHNGGRSKDSNLIATSNFKVESDEVNDYEEMEGCKGYMEEEGYMEMVSSPVRNTLACKVPGITSQLKRSPPSREKCSIELEEYQMPSDDKNALYAHCKHLNIKHYPHKSIKVGEELGRGQFGRVVRGTLTKEEEETEEGGQKEVLEVAIKTLKPSSDISSVVKFLREAVIMGQFSHPNVIRFYGVVTEGELKMLVLELLSGGDLQKMLRKLHPENSLNQDLPRTLLNYCRQVVSGMTYLSNKCFIHRDLAARNILVSEDNSCKIADFGMARDLINDDYYTTQGGRIPVKWTAPEALYYRKYSTASDVWSYGIVMFEMWSLGRQPYDGYNNTDTLDFIDAGRRLPPPPGCPRDIYSIMIKCWHSSPSSRPSFSSILQHLSLSDTKILMSEPPSSSVLPSSDGDQSPSVSPLGANPASSAQLYKDLQDTYV